LALAAARGGWCGTNEVATAASAEIPAEQLRDQRDNENMKRLVAFVLRADDSCIDVGANAGGLLSAIVRAAPRGRHVAFEPIPHLAAELRERYPEVEVREAAASNRFGISSFAHVHAAEGWSGLRFRPLPGGIEPQVEQISVTLEPIDEVVDPNFAPALVKIDVEGAEQQVIEGAMRTLRTHKPVVIFEHGAGSANVYGTTPDDVWRLLVEEAGLRIFDLDGHGPYSLGDLQHNYYAAIRVNFIAHA
jgi:FkbM family methyltransferase